MSSHDDPVQPTPFDVAQPAPVASPVARASSRETHTGTPAWVLPALGVLVALAVAVIIWLPASLELDEAEPDTPTPAQAATEPSGATSNSGAALQSDASPWSDAQAARERREAQEMAAELLELQYSLEERGVELWAAESFTAAKTLAAEGDAQYREGNYHDARQQYESSLTALKALEQSIPEQLQRLLDEAGRALENSDAAAADAALSVASTLSPDNPDVAALLARAALLPQLLTLLEQAQAAESGGDLPGAQAFLEQAITLDPAHQYAKSERDRIAALASEEAFNKAMSEGYAALAEGRYDSARKAFSKAAQIQQGSDEAASALAEVAAAESAGRLTALDRRGRGLEREEKWQQAVEVYQQASKIDASILFAREGLARSRPRAELDRQLQKVIDEPQRLSDVAVASQVEELLARANQASPTGPRLKSQIQKLDTLLEQANATVAVTLHSDGETEVIVYKVARLGRFAQRELTLRAGTYTAVGTRDGYRDVRRKFTLARDASPAAVTIICSEPI